MRGVLLLFLMVTSALIIVEDIGLSLCPHPRPENPRARPFVQTLTSQSEWTIVDVVAAYGRTLETVPFYSFPYMNLVSQYWWQMGEITAQVIERENSIVNAVFSQYFGMQLLMGTLLTVSFGSLSLISLPIRLAIAGLEADMVFVELTVPTWAADELMLELNVPANRYLGAVGHSRTDHDGQSFVTAWFPRYGKFNGAIRHFVTKYPFLEVTRIAGNTEIAAKFAWDKAYQQGCGPVNDIPGTTHVQPVLAIVDRCYQTNIVKVSNLPQIIRGLEPVSEIADDPPWSVPTSTSTSEWRGPRGIRNLPNFRLVHLFDF